MPKWRWWAYSTVLGSKNDPGELATVLQRYSTQNIATDID